jgi:hypothetical protein
MSIQVEEVPPLMRQHGVIDEIEPLNQNLAMVINNDQYDPEQLAEAALAAAIAEAQAEQV